MYGIVNKSIEELIKHHHGNEKWDAILKRSGVDTDFFISNQPYDDAITYQLAGAVSEELGVTVGDVLFLFGEWWILHTTKQKYGNLLQAGGKSLREFLINLPVFHNHIMMMYPKLTPPEFKVSEVQENSIQVHYFSKRVGLQSFVHGLLSGLSKLYETETQIALMQSRDDGADHEIFKVSWN